MFHLVLRSCVRRSLPALVLLLLTIIAPLASQASIFTAGSSNVFGPGDPRRNNNWHNEYNWEPEGIPSSQATIPAGQSVFLTQSVSIDSLTVAGNIGGSTGAENLAVTGSCDWSGGTIGGNGLGLFVIASGATLNLPGLGEKNLWSNLNNAGTINWTGGGTLRTGFTVTNTGTINITADTAFFGETGNGGTLNNSGTIIRSAGSGLFAIAGFDGDHHFMNLNNTGSVQVQTGTLQIGPGRSTGTFNVSSGAVLRAANHDFDATPLNGAGTYRFEPHDFAGSCRARGNIVRNGGPLELLGVGFEGGFPDVAGSTATLSGTGKLLWKNGSMPGNWTFAPGFRVEASTDGTKGFDGSMVNKGTFLWMGGGQLATGASTFVNEGTFTCTAPGLFLRDTYINSAHFENRGTFNSVANGENSTEDSDFLNSGTVNIGGAGVGILRIYSGYTQTATGKLRVDIGGSDATVPQFDQLKMGQGATLDGALNVNFINGFAPAADAVFRVITKNGGSGTFSSVTAQNLNGKTIVANYPYEAVDLVVQNINLSINDVSILEGNTGTSNLNFTVSLSQPASQAVTVNYVTLNSTATQPTDYSSRSGTLTIPAGLIKGVISVPVVGDTLDEVDESFFVNLSAPDGATLLDNQGRGTIIDNDATPTLSIVDLASLEGDTGTMNATFTVSLSAPSGKTVSVNAIPANGTALSPADYTTGGATLVFAPGETSKTFTVPVKGDTMDEEDEVFYVLLSSPINASISRARAECLIFDDDAAPTVSITGLQVKEYNAGQTTMAFTLSLSAPSGKVVRVSYATSDGTATAGSDYVAVAPTQVSFAVGSTIAYARVVINGDELYENSFDSLNVNLSSPVNATIATGHAIGSIIDDDAKPSLSINDVSISEGNASTKNLTFTVTLSKASGLNATVTYASANGTAQAGTDYVAKTGTLTFAAGGALTKTISIVINGDTLVEGDETLFVLLSGATNASVSKGRGIGTITNDDTSG